MHASTFLTLPLQKSPLASRDTCRQASGSTQPLQNEMRAPETKRAAARNCNNRQRKSISMLLVPLLLLTLLLMRFSYGATTLVTCI